MLFRWLVCIILVCTSVSAYKCHYGIHCQDVRIGLGTYYANFSSVALLTDVNSHNLGGFVSFEDSHYWKWFYFSANLAAGIAGSTINAISSEKGQTTIKDKSFFVIAEPRIGINLGSLSRPTFIYTTLFAEIYDFGFSNKIGRFRDVMMFWGLGVFHRFMLTPKFNLEAQTSFSMDINHRYTGYGFDTRSRLFDGSYKAELSLGILYRGNAYNSVEDLGEVLAQKSSFEMPDFYAKIKGMYYHMNALTMPYLDTQTLHHPEANNFVLMLEFGIGLNAPFN